MKVKITKDGRTYRYEGTAEEINKKLEEHGLIEKQKKKAKKMSDKHRTTQYNNLEQEKPEEDGEA